MSSTPTLYLRPMPKGAWSGDWAPVEARLEWMQSDRQVALFTVVDAGIDADDEYEFGMMGSLVLAVWDKQAGHFKGRAGLQMDDIWRLKGYLME